MSDRVKDILRQAGMNESEALMFRTLLEALETVSLKEVISFCEMTEFTGYRTARRLCEKGFAEIQKKGRLRYIKALPLERLAAKVGNESRKLRRLELKVSDLAKRYETSVSPRYRENAVQVLEGKENFLDTYDSIPDIGGNELFAFGSIGSFWRVTEADYFSGFEQQFIRRRVRRGMKAYLVDTQDSIFQLLMKKAGRELRDMRVLRDGIEGSQYTILSENQAFIFENNELLPVVSIIHNERLVRMLQHYHSMLWEIAKARG